jgi:hypothetical protein
VAIYEQSLKQNEVRRVTEKEGDIQIEGGQSAQEQIATISKPAANKGYKYNFVDYNAASMVL